LEFSLSYVTNYTKRTAMKDQLFTKIVEEVANNKGRLEWASPAVGPASPTAARDAIEARPSSSTQAAGKATGSH
jgi:hypothetical protein